MKPNSILCLALLAVIVFVHGVGDNCDAAIVYPKAPKDGQQVVREYVGKTLRAIPSALKGIRMQDVTIADPLGDYSVGLSDLASGRMLSAATTRSWRYILLRGTNAAGVTELFLTGPTGNTLKCSGLYEGNFGKETLAALREAKDLPQVKGQDYEPRYLNIASVSFVAIWLHGKADDIIIPLPPTYGRMDPYQSYSESQIIRILRPEAERDMESPNLIR